MNNSGNYKEDYEAAKRELAELIAQQDALERRKLVLRRKIELLAALCESEGIVVEPSREALFLVEHSKLADEIRFILKGNFPEWLRPHRIKGVLETLGHDLRRYENPQATIQTILKRMVESGEAEEREMPDDGKRAYRCPSTMETIIRAYEDNPAISSIDAAAMIKTLRKNKK